MTVATVGGSPGHPTTTTQPACLMALHGDCSHHSSAEAGDSPLLEAVPQWSCGLTPPLHPYGHHGRVEWTSMDSALCFVPITKQYHN
jgi:hypothetical protein